MNIPSIGGTRGIFEIFIPGAFLFLNIVAFVYFIPETPVDIRSKLTSFASNQLISLVVLISFGYLIGVILRLLKTRRADKLSGLCCWIWYSKLKKDKKEYWFEPFPYFNYLKRLSTNKLPTEAKTFFKKVWEPRQKQTTDGNREFFNYCKVMIASNDERNANDIYSAEALSRYVSGMFYALITSLLLMLFILFSMSFQLHVLVVVVAYSLAIIIILLNFRFLRVKEVETVFAAALSQYLKDLKEGKAA